MAVSIEKDLAVIDRGLTALRVDYERFFTGELKRPPVVLRRSIAETLKRCGNEQVERAAERFRLLSLQGRFTAMTELWDKRLQAREEGRDRVFRVHAPSRTDSTASPAPDADASASVRKRRRTDIMPLFERYCAARRALGEDIAKIRFERFEELLKRKASEIRRLTGAARLVFEIQTVEGRVRLVGRPAGLRPAEKGPE
jgi:hypothetical protein